MATKVIPINLITGTNTASGIWTYNAFQSANSTSIGELSSDLKDDTNTGTGYSLDVTAVFGGGAGSPAAATTGTTTFPDTVLDYYWYTNGTATLQIGNLTAGSTYTIKAVGHNGSQAVRDCDFTVGATTERYNNSGTATPSEEVTLTGTVSGTTLDIDATVVSVFAYVNALSVEITDPTGLTIDSTDSTMQRGTNFELVCSGATTAPTTANTTLSNGNDTLTPSSVTGSDPYTITFAVGDLTKQVDATGYDWTLEITP